MSSRLLGLADAAVAALNAAPAGTFGLEFTAERRLLPFVDLKLIGTKLLVYVVGVGRIDVRQGNVASFTGEYDLALLVQQRFQPTDDVEAKGELRRKVQDRAVRGVRVQAHQPLPENPEMREERARASRVLRGDKGLYQVRREFA